MDAARPSQTALAAARHRAAHQVLEQGRIFADPLALTILGDDASEAVQLARADPGTRRMRIFIAVRSRFAEDTLDKAIAGGVLQVVVLGAGLDTWAYRSAGREHLRIIEVDHPATQEWKRELLDRAAIPVPGELTFAPIDFERESLAEGLDGAGFDRDLPTFFTWLGVVRYLTEDAVWSTLTLIARLPHGAHVVFDYSDPPDTLPTDARARHEARAARVAEIGEAFVTHFEADRGRDELMALGFTHIEDLGPARLAERYFPGRGALPDRGGHVVYAATDS